VRQKAQLHRTDTIKQPFTNSNPTAPFLFLHTKDFENKALSYATQSFQAKEQLMACLLLRFNQGISLSKETWHIGIIA